MKRVYLIFVAIFFLCNYLTAEENMDSLWNIWQNENELDSNRVLALHNVAWGLIQIDADSALKLTEIENAFAHKHQLNKYIGLSNNTKSIYYRTKSNYPKALEYSFEAIKYFEKCNYKIGKSNSFNTIAIIYANQQNWEKALEYFKKSYEIKKQFKEPPYSMPSLIMNIGNIYDELGEQGKTIKYYKEAKELYVKMERGGGVALINQNTALLFLNIYNKIQNDTLAYDVPIEIKSWIGNNDEILLDSALTLMTASINYYLETGKKVKLSNQFINLGDIYLTKKQDTKALYWFLKGYEFADSLGLKRDQMKSSQAIYDAYKLKGDLNKALHWLEVHYSVYKDLVNDENNKAIQEQEIKYKYEKKNLADSLEFAKQQEIKDLQIAEQEATLENQRTQKIALYGGLILVLLFSGFMYNRFKVTHKQKLVIEEQKHEVENQKSIVELKNQEITDSITYAKRIQTAILPPTGLLNDYLNDGFIYYEPKDVVAGDFYWLEHIEGEVLFAAADCTGHGVPGAMISVVCHNALNRAVREFGLVEPALILNKVKELVIETFELSKEDVKDGMDIALCALNKEKTQLNYAGANNPLWIVRKSESLKVESDKGEFNNYELSTCDFTLYELKADKQPISKHINDAPFTNHKVEVQKGDSIYLFTDGFADQFGGEKGKKFKYKPFKELLISIQDKSMDEQSEIIKKEFHNWRGDLEQVDDVCILGVRI